MLSGAGEECALLIGGADNELANDLDLKCLENGEWLRGRIGYVVVDGVEKEDGAFEHSGAVARLGVSGRKIALPLLVLAGSLRVSTTSRVDGTGVRGGSETCGTILRVRGGDVNMKSKLNEKL